MNTVFTKKLLALIIVLSLNSCALMFIPKNQKDITIVTKNPDAKVYVDNELEGEGKRVVVPKIKKTGIKEVVVRQPDHKDATFLMAPYKRTLAYIPLRLLTWTTFYGVFFEYGTEAQFYPYDKRYVFVNDYLIPKRQENQKYINYTATKVNIQDVKKDLESFSISYTPNFEEDFKREQESVKKKNEKDALKNKKKAKTKEKLNEDDNSIEAEDSYFSKDILETLKKGNFVDTTGKILINKSNVVNLESSIVGGRIFRANPKYYSAKLIYTELDIDWLLKNQYGEIVDSIRTSDRSDYFTTMDKGIERALADAVNNSFLFLLEKESFSKHLEIKDEVIEDLEILQINKPKSVVTNSKESLKAAAIINIRGNKGHGSGFAISNDGYVLTNYHVVAGTRAGQYKDFYVIMPDGSEAEAEVARIDPKNDVALLKVDAKFDKAFILNNKKTFEVLDEVYSLGAPASVDLGSTITLGILSNERKTDGVERLQLNMSISPGNSGGPVFSREGGTLIGIISSKLVGGATEGIAFAIPSHNVAKNLFISY